MVRESKEVLRFLGLGWEVILKDVLVYLLGILLVKKLVLLVTKVKVFRPEEVLDRSWVRLRDKVTVGRARATAVFREVDYLMEVDFLVVRRLPMVLVGILEVFRVETDFLAEVRAAVDFLVEVRAAVDFLVEVLVMEDFLEGFPEDPLVVVQAIPLAMCQHGWED